MWRERVIRFLLIGGAAFIILTGIRYLVAGREELVSVPELPINEKQIEPLKEEILGAVGRVLPGGKKEETVKEEVIQEEEPSLEPVQNVQEQTQDLIESIKNLPEDQVKAIKKQIYKEFCEALLEE